MRFTPLLASYWPCKMASLISATARSSLSPDNCISLFIVLFHIVYAVRGKLQILGFKLLLLGDKLRLEGLDTSKHILGIVVNHFFANHFLVLIKGQVVVVLTDFIYRHQETLVLSCTIGLGIQMLPTLQQVGDIIVAARCALGIERKTIATPSPRIS